MKKSFWICCKFFLLSVSIPAQDSTLVPEFLDTPTITVDGHVRPLLAVTGFLESRVGGRIATHQQDGFTHLAEARLHLQAEPTLGPLTLNLSSDLVLDPVIWGTNSQPRGMNRDLGASAIDIRQANVVFSPTSTIDVKIGRQIMTWGTGDLLFINDLFAKDFRSLFLGRDDEYLKAPLTSGKMSLYLDFATFDLVYTPRFTPDRFINGTRISFFDRSTDEIRNRANPLDANIPSRWFRDDELSIRVYRFLGAFESALYYYRGFWKSPGGLDSISGKATFPKLGVYGTSLRGPLGEGIVSLEGGYYHSPLASTGSASKNNEIRIFVGYEIELGQDFTLGVQYYVERRLRRKEYTGLWPYGVGIEGKVRDLFTARITKLLLQQNLRISLFNFFSPSDQDGYLRCQASYKISDALKIDGGLNLFYGRDKFTFFNQLQSNNNIYFGLRYAF